MVLFQVLFLNVFLIPLSVDVEYEGRKENKEKTGKFPIFQEAKRGEQRETFFSRISFECCEVENDDETSRKLRVFPPHSYRIIKSNLNINNGLVLL